MLMENLGDVSGDISLYTNVEKAIDKAVAIGREALDDDERNSSSGQLLEGFAKKALPQVHELKDLAEFKRLIIAFYGETKAGKSTIIETLRILLGEKTKLNTREKFKKAAEFPQEMQRIQSEIQQLASRIASGEDAEALLPHISALQQEKQSILTAEKLQDGIIIGDGRSDFTQETTAYEFEWNGVAFTLFDVPGIEGEENKVVEEIWRAVKKAHAIFYVTKGAKPPESGTVEKIAAHLGDHTGVWAVFNKPCASPRALKETLLKDDEQKGLDEMDTKLHEALGGAWQGIRSISALPAFYACADCLLQDNPEYTNREKFRSHLPPDTLLQRSGMGAFRQFLCGELLADTKTRIKITNSKKLAAIIVEMLRIMSNDACAYDATLKKIESELADAAEQIRQAREIVERALPREAHTLLEDKRCGLRKKMHEYIEKDVTDDRLQAYFDMHIELLKETLEKEFDVKRQNVFSQYRETVNRVRDRYREHIKEIFKEANLAFDPESAILEESRKVMDMPWVETAGAIVTFVGMVGTAPAWLVWTLGALTVGSIAMKLHKWWDKKTAQRKSVDEQINKIFSELRMQFDKKCSEDIAELKAKARAYNEMPCTIRKRMDSTRLSFITTGEHLWHLVRQLGADDSNWPALAEAQASWNKFRQLP